MSVNLVYIESPPCEICGGELDYTDKEYGWATIDHSTRHMECGMDKLTHDETPLRSDGTYPPEHQAWLDDLKRRS